MHSSLIRSTGHIATIGLAMNKNAGVPLNPRSSIIVPQYFAPIL